MIVNNHQNMCSTKVFNRNLKNYYLWKTRKCKQHQSTIIEYYIYAAQS